MPIFFEQEVDKDTRLALWRITEAEDFFDVPLQRSITHPHKRLQHLGGRYLLRYLFPEFPLSLIQVADTRKPYLENEAFHFSISHCADFAAAIVSRSQRVGIDAEIPSDKVQRIRHKYLSPEEESRISGRTDLLPVQLATLVWSAKEAAFKWYGRGGVDFRGDMPVTGLAVAGQRLRTTLQFGKDVQRAVDVYSEKLDGPVLSWIAT